jgi:hypothetical protein
LIVVVSLLALLAEYFPQLHGMRVLRLVRVLRPLRVISRDAGLKLIITTTLRTMPSVSNVVGVMLALQLVFAILGMQIFQGRLASCHDEHDHLPEIATEAECLATAGHQWYNNGVGSFDDFASAMHLLYVMSTGDEWEASMYMMMDANDAGHAPVRNDASAGGLFAIAWMVVGFIFAQNLVVGVVVQDFSSRSKEQSGTQLLTPAQAQWVATMQAAARRTPSQAPRPPKDSRWRKALYRIVTSSLFDSSISAVVMANVFLMACDYYGMDDDVAVSSAYDLTLHYFMYVYYVECVLKLIGLGVAQYFNDAWCRFDFFLVCTALLDQFATDLLVQYVPVPPMLLRVLRVFRILRILRLLKRAKQLRNLIVTLVLSIPSLFNVAALLMLIIFTYAVLGVQLFTFLAPGEMIDDKRNFHTMTSAALLLFQCLTGDGWSKYMGDAGVQAESGLCSVAAGDCGSRAAIPYFLTFQLIGNFIFLNLFVAVILENFATLHNTDQCLVATYDLEVFNSAWSQLDPDATNFLPTTKLALLLHSVPRPLGLQGTSEQHAARMCLRLALPQHMGLVSYGEVLTELIDNNYFRSGTPEGIAKTGGSYDEDEFKGIVAAAGVATPECDLGLSSAAGSAASAAWQSHERASRCLCVSADDTYSTSAETVAHVYALQIIRSHISRPVLDRWRVRMLKKVKDVLLARANSAASPPHLPHKVSTFSSMMDTMAEQAATTMPPRASVAPAAATPPQSAPPPMALPAPARAPTRRPPALPSKAVKKPPAPAQRSLTKKLYLALPGTKRAAAV